MKIRVKEQRNYFNCRVNLRSYNEYLFSVNHSKVIALAFDSPRLPMAGAGRLRSPLHPDPR